MTKYCTLVVSKDTGKNLAKTYFFFQDIPSQIEEQFVRSTRYLSANPVSHHLLPSFSSHFSKFASSSNPPPLSSVLPLYPATDPATEQDPSLQVRPRREDTNQARQRLTVPSLRPVLGPPRFTTHVVSHQPRAPSQDPVRGEPLPRADKCRNSPTALFPGYETHDSRTRSYPNHEESAKSVRQFRDPCVTYPTRL
jgi:hypothetical protein